MEKELRNTAKRLIYLVEDQGWGETTYLSGTIEDAKLLEDNGLLEEHQSIPSIEISYEDCRRNLLDNDFNYDSDFDFNRIPNIIDLLGEYRCDTPENEGKITIFELCIRKYAAYFLKEPGNLPSVITIEECKDMLKEIVLWHEVGHWITHWMLDKAGNRWNSEMYNVFNSDGKNLHEGLAQLFAHYAISNNQEWRPYQEKIFEMMLKNQTACYLKHIDILKHKNFSMKNVLNAIQKIRTEKNKQNINLKSFLHILEESALIGN
jgi:hypothetical protein